MSNKERPPTALVSSSRQAQSHPLTAPAAADDPGAEDRLGPRLEPRARRRDTAAISAFVRGLTAASGDSGAQV